MTMNTQIEQDRPMYGVWIPSEGWLRGTDIFADYDYSKAREVSRLIGKGAHVRFIDKAIVELERHYLDNEKRSLWHTFKTWLQRKTNTPASSK